MPLYIPVQNNERNTKMIKAYSSKQKELTKPIYFCSKNCGGVLWHWYADSESEIKDWWYGNDYDGPANDDEIVDAMIRGADFDKITDYNMNSIGTDTVWFEDLCRFMNIDKNSTLFATNQVK